MEPIKKDVKNLKEFIIMVARGVGIGIEANSDGKIDLNDAALLFKILPTIGPAIADIGQIPGEISDLDESEAAELVAAIAGEFSLNDEAAKNLIEVSFKAISINIQLVKAVQGIIKKPSA